MPRSFVIALLCLGIVLVSPLVHALYRHWRRRRARPLRVVMVGTHAMTYHLAAVLMHSPVARYVVQGCIEAGDAPLPVADRESVPLLGPLHALPAILTAHQPDLVVVALPEQQSPLVWNMLLTMPTSGRPIIDGPTLYEQLTGQVYLHPAYTPCLGVCGRGPAFEVAKRLTDLLLASVSLCVALPIMAILALLIKLTSRGPVFFCQERVDRQGRTFTLIKFRTMVPDAEKLTGPVWAQEQDPRVTRLGQFLRRTALDEIPQLFNILKGDMSLVGPRPERPHFVQQLAHQLPGYTQRLSVKPGLTGWAQVSYGYGANLEDAMEKLGFDLHYIQHRSFLLDLWIMIRTVPKVVGARVALRAPSPSPTCISRSTDLISKLI